MSDFVDFFAIVVSSNTRKVASNLMMVVVAVTLEGRMFTII